MKQPNNSLQVPKLARNTRKIALSKLSNRCFWQSKHDLIYHMVKLKAARSAHSMADVIPFLAHLIFPSNTTLQYNQKKIYFLHKKENSIHNIVCVLMFQQLLTNKHDGLCDIRFGQVEVWIWSQTTEKQQSHNSRITLSMAILSVVVISLPMT